MHHLERELRDNVNKQILYILRNTTEDEIGLEYLVSRYPCNFTLEMLEVLDTRNKGTRYIETLIDFSAVTVEVLMQRNDIIDPEYIKYLFNEAKNERELEWVMNTNNDTREIKA